MLLSFFVSPCATAQYYGLGINIPLLASGTVNLSFEAAVAPHWSVEIPVMWNPVRTQRLQMKFASVQPGVRYWLFEEYTGHFVGMHLRPLSIISEIRNVIVTDEGAVAVFPTDIRGSFLPDGILRLKPG